MTPTGDSVKGGFWITVLTDSDDAVLNTFHQQLTLPSGTSLLTLKWERKEGASRSGGMDVKIHRHVFVICITTALPPQGVF